MDIELGSSSALAQLTEGLERGDAKRSASPTDRSQKASALDFADIFSSAVLGNEAATSASIGTESVERLQEDGVTPQAEASMAVDMSLLLAQLTGGVAPLRSQKGVPGSAKLTDGNSTVDLASKDGSEGGVHLLLPEVKVAMSLQRGSTLARIHNVHELESDAMEMSGDGERQILDAIAAQESSVARLERVETSAPILAKLGDAVLVESAFSVGAGQSGVDLPAQSDLSSHLEIPPGASPTVGSERTTHEQVAYWMGVDVQGAEMEIQGPGSEKLGVTISLEGTVADVMFRTDEALTRSLIEGSSNHLRDMLDQQGVTLAGVSIGANSGGAKGGQENKQGQNSDRRPEVEVLTAVTRKPVNTGMVGSALDLFV
jgi:flagellar hook-length control protein FliK